MSGRVYDAQLPVEQFRLKVASKALVKAVHGTETAGEIAGMRQQRVSECTLPNCPTFFTIDQAQALEEAAKGSPGWPHVTRALARNHGFALLPLPESAPGSGEWHRTISEVSREAGDAVGKVCEALADDGEVTSSDVKQLDLLNEIDEAIAALAKLRGMVVSVSEGRD